MPHDEAGAGILGRGGVVAVVAAGVVVLLESPEAAAVVDFEPQAMVALCEVDRLDDHEVGVVLDHAARVPRRIGDVDDDGVAGILGIDFAEGAAEELLLSADRTKGASLERRLLHPLDLDPRDPGLRPRSVRKR